MFFGWLWLYYASCMHDDQSLTIIMHEYDYFVQCKLSLNIFFRILISGPSQSGKTTFILQCLKFRDEIFSTKFEKILYFLPSDTQYSKDAFIRMLERDFNNVEVHFGLPDNTHIYTTKNLPKMFIIDDQVQKLSKFYIYYQNIWRLCKYFNFSDERSRIFHYDGKDFYTR